MAATVIRTIADLREALRPIRNQGGDIGFVPTMGFLHEGHLTLVRRALGENDRVVVSIFVNPLQFAPNEDLASYPRDLGRDIALLAGQGDLIAFAPDVTEMYPRPMATEVSLPSLSQVLCGRSRPTHFQGVATVVLKLLWIVQPTRVYFGQKDGQQVAVVRRMIEDLSVPVEMRVVPTVRESSGLALSSRNIYLRPEDQPLALSLQEALTAGRALLEQGERRGPTVQAAMRAVFDRHPEVRLDYAEVVDAGGLEPLADVRGQVLLAVAAHVGRARLIDNLLLDVDAAAVRDALT